jgi:uncharacterized protein YjbI with pentapeptide repeats
MKQKLATYLDAAFAPYRDEPSVQETKEELLSDLLEKFHELKAQGMSDEDAYEATVNSIGDVSEIVAGHHEERVRPTRTRNVSSKKLLGSDLSGSAVHDGRFTHSALKGTDLSRSDLSGSVFESTDLREATFDGSDLSHAEFKHAALAGASFKGCKLNHTIFSRSALPGVSFDGQTLVGTIFNGAGIKDTSFKHAILRSVSFENTNVKKAHFDGAVMDKLTYAVLQGLGADLQNVTVISDQGE